MKNKIKNLDKRFLWIFLGLGSVLVRILVGTNSLFIENFYSRGLFLGIRTLLDYTFGLIPVPFLYVLILILLVVIILKTKRGLQSQKPFLQKLGSFLFSIFAFLGMIIFLFLFLWGFNYSRIPLESQLRIQPNPLSIKELKQELDLNTKKLIEKRARVPNVDSLSFNESHLPPKMESQIRKELAFTLKSLGYPDIGNPPLRLLRPKGVLLRISTAGFYLPLTGECNVDSGLHPIQLPFVIAHEYSHAYGITDEGSCNFLAYLEL